jgi:hypothetical protein
MIVLNLINRLARFVQSGEFSSVVIIMDHPADFHYEDSSDTQSFRGNSTSSKSKYYLERFFFYVGFTQGTSVRFVAVLGTILSGRLSQLAGSHET